MELKINEQQYQALAKLLYGVTQKDFSSSIQKRAKELMDQFDGLRKNIPNTQDRLSLDTNQVHRVVTVLSKIERGDFIQDTVREATNALRNLENQRVQEAPNWKLNELRQTFAWDRIHENVVKIGINEMDYRAAEKVLRDLSEGKESAITESIASMTGKVFQNYQENGNDPSENYEMKVDPKLFARITEAIQKSWPVSDEIRENAGQLLKELQVERAFEARRDDADLLEKILKYLAEMISKIFEVFERRELDEQSKSVEQDHALSEGFKQYSDRLLADIGVNKQKDQDTQRETLTYSVDGKDVSMNASDKTMVDYYHKQFLKQLDEHAKDPSVVPALTKGAIESVLKDSQVSIEQKADRIFGLLLASYEKASELQRPADLEKEIEQAAEIPGKIETQETDKEIKPNLRELLISHIGDKIPGQIPNSKELNQEVKDYRIKNDVLWYKTGPDFKAIKLHDGPYGTEERNNIMDRALSGKDAAARNEVKQVAAQAEKLVVKEVEFSR